MCADASAVDLLARRMERRALHVARGDPCAANVPSLSASASADRTAKDVSANSRPAAGWTGRRSGAGVAKEAVPDAAVAAPPTDVAPVDREPGQKGATPAMGQCRQGYMGFSFFGAFCPERYVCRSEKQDARAS
jgi:hypothetical protein